jgi:Ras family
LHLELQKNVTEEMVLCLVGNKTDLVNSRIVTQDEALQYAQTIGATYFECSALQDHGKYKYIIGILATQFTRALFAKLFLLYLKTHAQAKCYLYMFVISGIEEIFLATAMELLNLSKQEGNTLKVYDPEKLTAPATEEEIGNVSLETVALGEPTKGLCC